MPQSTQSEVEQASEALLETDNQDHVLPVDDVSTETEQQAVIVPEDAEPVEARAVDDSHAQSTPSINGTANDDVASDIAAPIRKTVWTGNYSDYLVDLSTEGTWPPPLFVRKDLPPNERFYFEHRWHSQWSYYDTKAQENKALYYRLQSIIVIGSVIVPALVSFNPTLARFIVGVSGVENNVAVVETLVRTAIDFVTVFVSLSVAVAAALESLKKYGDNWNSYRAAAEELQAEKNFFDMGAGAYATSPNRFATFVERCEGIIANQNGRYFQAMQQSIKQNSEQNQEILNNYKDDANLMTNSSTTSTTTSESVPTAG